VSFAGAKIALICGSRLVVLRRDDIPTIPYPGLIDLPGGGREADETPEETVLREVREETGFSLPQERLSWRRLYRQGPRRQWMFRADIDDAEFRGMQLGDEGQALWLMEVEAFVVAQDAVAHLQSRVREAVGLR